MPLIAHPEGVVGKVNVPVLEITQAADVGMAAPRITARPVRWLGVSCNARRAPHALHLRVPRRHAIEQYASRNRE